MCIATCSLFKTSMHPIGCSVAKRFSSTLYPRAISSQETRLTRLWSDFKEHQDSCFFLKNFLSRQDVKSFSQKMHLHGIYTAETIPQAHAPSTVYLPELPSALLMRLYGRNCLSKESKLPVIFQEGLNSHERIGLIQLNKQVYRVRHIYENGVCARLFIDKGPTQIDVKGSPEDWLDSLFKDVIFKEQIEFETEGAAQGLPKQETLYLHVDGDLKTLQTRRSYYNKTGTLARQFFQNGPPTSISQFFWDYNTAGYLTNMHTPTGTVNYRRNKQGNLIERTFTTGLTSYYTYDVNKNLTTLREVSPNHQTRIWIYTHREKQTEELDPQDKENTHLFNADGIEVELSSCISLDGKQVNRRIRWIHNESDLVLWKGKKHHPNEIVAAYDVSRGILLPPKNRSFSRKAIEYKIDDLGRPSVKTERINGNLHTIRFGYEGLFLTSEIHSNGKHYSYHYDVVGNLIKQCFGGKVEREYFYDAFRRMVIQIDHGGLNSTTITRYHYEGEISIPPTQIPTLTLKSKQNVKWIEMSCNVWGEIKQTSQSTFRTEDFLSSKPSRNV